MNRERITAVIRAVEAGDDPGAATYRDFELWPVVRLMLGAADKATHRPASRRHVRRLLTLPAAPTQALSSVRPPRQPANARWAAFLNQRSSLQGPVAGRFSDVYGDPLRRLLSDRDVVLDVWDWGDVEGRRRPTAAPVTPVDIGLLTSAALALARRRAGRAPGTLVRSLERLLAAVSREGVQLDLDEAVIRVLAVDHIAKFVARRLGRQPPQLGFVMCFYALPGLGFTLGCRRRGVLSVDIQHGVQGAGHLAYGRWSGAPGPRSALVPDRFWCWRGDDAAWIDEAFGAGRAVVGGNLLLDGAEDLPRPEGLRRPRAPREILVSLQPNLPLPEAVAAAIVDGPADWRWWLRPHPQMAVADAASLVPDAGRDRVVVDDAAAAPLPALLRRVDVHVTGYSSVVLEAEALGVPSLLTDPAAGRWFLGDQLTRGHATLATTRDELLEQIRTAGPLERDRPPDPAAAVRALLGAAGLPA